MILLYILLGLLFLVLLLPMGLRVRYSAAGLGLALVIGPVRLRLLPRKEGRPKRPKEKQEKKKEPQEAPKPAADQPGQKKKGGDVGKLFAYVPVALDLLEAVRRSLVVRNLELLVNLAGDDPCDLAVSYGRAWAAIGNMLPILERSFHIRRRDVQVFCDFTAEKTEVYADLEIVAAPARLIAVFCRYGFRMLKIYWNQNMKKAVQ